MVNTKFKITPLNGHKFNLRCAFEVLPMRTFLIVRDWGSYDVTEIIIERIDGRIVRQTVYLEEIAR